ncbi:MAG TPA: hypothetical protein ENJ53_04320 [Phaeodactylibacter sp.]|nr:hypothetical protein [Phaeodactylibacter sp.]
MKRINLFPLFFLAILFWLQITQTSCTNDHLPEPTPNPLCDSISITYDGLIKPIIDASCASTGCHVVGFPKGDYTTYAQMKSSLNDNGFKKQVIDTKNMPIGTTLTPEEFELLECWALNGYPEN